MSRAIFALAAISFVAGCAGARTAPPVIGSQGAPVFDRGTASSFNGEATADAGPKGTMIFRITIPTNGGGSNGETYVSPASKGMWLVLTGASELYQAFALGSHDPGCSTVKKGGAVTCTVKKSLPAGYYTASITVYDQPPIRFPSAHVLSMVSNAPLIIIGGKSNRFAPTLAGVPASLTVSGLQNSCTAFGPTPFTVHASDADGHVIVGAYAPTISLSDSDKSGNTTIATGGPDNPPAGALISSLDTATIAWNGYGVGSVTITAQSGNVSGSDSFSAGTKPSSQLFTYAYGNTQNFVVPPCATTIYVTAVGATGGKGENGASGGEGGSASGTIPTTPGETLVLVVGGSGYPYGGFNGGGVGNYGYGLSGGIGGGATDVRQGGSDLSNRIVVAGGGGGGGGANGTGGSGGGSTGGAGAYIDVGSCDFSGGGGGTQTAGGAGGNGNYYAQGSFGQGGPGQGYCSQISDAGAGGGGGGWYGGGGGYDGSGGGGGSGYVEPSATNVLLQNGVGYGNEQGSVLICWGFPNSECGTAAVKNRARHNHILKTSQGSDRKPSR